MQILLWLGSYSGEQIIETPDAARGHVLTCWGSCSFVLSSRMVVHAAGAGVEPTRLPAHPGRGAPEGHPLLHAPWRQKSSFHKCRPCHLQSASHCRYAFWCGTRAGCWALYLHSGISFQLGSESGSCRQAVKRHASSYERCWFADARAVAVFHLLKAPDLELDSFHLVYDSRACCCLIR